MPSNSLTSKRNRHLIDRLRGLGLSEYVALPQIVAMGDTSSGKSSVLSALSGITFPSSDKLTTRCPTELILSSSIEFSGTVHLQRYNGIKEAHVILKSPEMITTEIQLLTQKLVDEGQHISEDAIIVTVQGPNYPDLTLTDLPGLVRTVADHEDHSIIASVSAMVHRYMLKPRTIILAVHPANVDIHNSEILESAQRADPEGLRTICVLTKLDLVDEGAEDSVIDILNNETVKVLQLGYHAVKCRGQKSINENLTIEDAKKSESSFFCGHSKWSSVASDLFGIDRLAGRLVLLLEESIAQTLPQVITEINTLMISGKNKIDKLGICMQSDAERRIYFSSITDNYLQLIKSAIVGDYDSQFFDESGNSEIENRLAATLHKFNRDFAEKMSAFKFDTMSYPEYRAAKKGEEVEVWLDGVWKSYQVTVDNERKLVYKNVCLEFYEYLPGKPCSSNHWRYKPVRDLSKLKKSISDNRGGELSIFPSFKVFASIIRSYVDQWNKIMDDLLRNYHKEILSVIERAIDACFPNNLVPLCKYKTTGILEDLLSLTKLELQKAISQELDPHTLNHYLEDILIKLRNKDLLDFWNKADPEIFTKAFVIATLKAYGIGSMSPEDRQALEMSWALTAYIKVARKRFTDRIPQTMNYFFVNEVEIRSKAELRSVGDQELANLLAESPNTATYRMKLTKQLNALELSKAEILKF